MNICAYHCHCLLLLLLKEAAQWYSIYHLMVTNTLVLLWNMANKYYLYIQRMRMECVYVFHIVIPWCHVSLSMPASSSCSLSLRDFTEDNSRTEDVVAVATVVHCDKNDSQHSCMLYRENVECRLNVERFKRALTIIWSTVWAFIQLRLFQKRIWSWILLKIKVFKNFIFKLINFFKSL